jgi:hypothetical protein
MVSNYGSTLGAALERGESLDCALESLREQGASALESIKAVREVKSISLGTAKRLVLNSPAWKDGLETHRRLVDDILGALEAEQSS